MKKIRFLILIIGIITFGVFCNGGYAQFIDGPSQYANTTPGTFVGPRQASQPVTTVQTAGIKTSTCDAACQLQKNIEPEVKKIAESAEARATSRRRAELQQLGIVLDTDCIASAGCSFSIYDALDIRQDRAPNERTSVMTFVQDIILGATYFIGTVVMIALIVSGFWYVLSPVDSGYKKKASAGIKYALIGLVVVMMALVIIRLVQFLAKAGS